MALPHIFRKGYGYKVIMVTLLDIMPAQYQDWLWIDPKEDIKKRKLMDAVDQITSSYGRGSITLAKILDLRRLADEKRIPKPKCYNGY